MVANNDGFSGVKRRLKMEQFFLDIRKSRHRASGNGEVSQKETEASLLFLTGSIVSQKCTCKAGPCLVSLA